jgi:hypothetical protein
MIAMLWKNCNRYKGSWTQVDCSLEDHWLDDEPNLIRVVAAHVNHVLHWASILNENIAEIVRHDAFCFRLNLGQATANV